jgi:hypothetical protein
MTAKGTHEVIGRFFMIVGAVQRFSESSVNTFIRIVQGAPSPQTIRREDSRPR